MGDDDEMNEKGTADAQNNTLQCLIYTNETMSALFGEEIGPEIAQ